MATDATGLSSTSSVVTLTVSTNTAPPVVAAKTPAPGSVTNLTQISVTFTPNGPTAVLAWGGHIANRLESLALLRSTGAYPIHFKEEQGSARRALGTLYRIAAGW